VVLFKADLAMMRFLIVDVLRLGPLRHRQSPVLRFYLKFTKLRRKKSSFSHDKNPCNFRDLQRTNTLSSHSASNITDLPELWLTALERA
jgi:hypothetical protein